MSAGIVVDHWLPAQQSLRIAVVTETYPPEVNGVASTASRVVEGLHQRGHKLQLVRPRQGPGERPVEGDRLVEVLLRGLPIPRYPQLKMGLPARGALVELWGRRRPDVVHIVTEGPLGWSALHAALRLKLPVVSDFRTNFHAYSRHYGIKWLHDPIMGYLRKFHNRTACTMVPTEALRADLETRGFRGVAVVARGVDAQRFDPARRSAALRAAWGVAEGDPVVLHVGRLAPEKNLALLADAFDAMRREQPRARLVVVGDGPGAAALRSRCPDAVFAGVRRGDELAAHYASGDLFLFPSLTETFGNVVPEAMASGLALLAFDCAAAQLLVRHGQNGLVAPVGDEATFIALARRLVGDRVAARQLGRAARTAALALDWSRIVRQVESHYAAAIDGTAGATRGGWASPRPMAQ